MVKIDNDDSRYFNFLKIFLFVAPFFIGGYHVAVSALISVTLCLFLLVKNVLCSDKKIQLTFTTLVLMLIPVAYLVTSIWAVDCGTAIYGFIKFMPVFLFGLAISPYSNKERAQLLDIIPLSAVSMGVLSYSLSFTDFGEKFFLVASRLGGFFQYPNTFAAYCLVGVTVLLLKDKITRKDWIIAGILVAIIFLTGSRTVFVFFVAVSFVLLMRIRKTDRLILSGLILLAIVISIVVVVATDSVQTVGRYLTISLESSTLLGRLLYYKDALSEIISHPFGLGYYGYYYSQGSFQSGVYSVAFVHNDALQLLLDIGWVPAIAFFWLVLKSLLSKNTDLRQKMVLFIIFGHSMFDFDLQFICMFIVLILTFDFETKAMVTVKYTDIFVFISSVLFVLINLYFGIVNSLFLFGKYEAVEKLYGADTQSEIQLMIAESDYDEIVVYADEIISRNKYVTIAYDAKANYEFKNGNFPKVIEYKNKAIECSKYSVNEYNDYCKKLIVAMDIYQRNDDKTSVAYCLNELVGVSDKLERVKAETSEIAWKLKDKPQLELDEDYAVYIKELKNVR